MNTENFYAELPILTEFIELADPTRYVIAPDDWYVLITDIVGSTAAITAGNYKEVNLLGASSIIAVLNVLYPLEIPYVFGGDGASLLVPPHYLSSAREALLEVQAIAQQMFQMTLRVGSIPVATVNARYPLKVAKFKLAPDYAQASFLGGGITYATELVKADPTYQLTRPKGLLPLGQVNLDGLECRWQEVANPKGQTLSLIVAAVEAETRTSQQTYQAVLGAIAHIYGSPQHYHPIPLPHLHLSFNPRKLMAEAKVKARRRRERLTYLLRIFWENCLGWLFMTFGLVVGGVAWGNYKSEVCAASDYQKIDDVLRMVLASCPEETERLQTYLEDAYQQGHLRYGLHISDRALLTCLILNRQGGHFHLVDGSDGGYAIAAQQLKAQAIHRDPPNVVPPLS